LEMKIRRTGSSKEQEQRCSRAGKNTSKEDRFEETNIVCYNLTIFSKRVPVLRISRVRVESMRVLHTISPGPPFPVANRETVPSHRTKSARNRGCAKYHDQPVYKNSAWRNTPAGGREGGFAQLFEVGTAVTRDLGNSPSRRSGSRHTVPPRYNTASSGECARSLSRAAPSSYVALARSCCSA